MSTPDPTPPTDLEPARPAPGWLPVAQPRPPAPATRTTRAVLWVGGYLGELAGVGVSLTLTLAVSSWFAALTGAVVALWVAHEYQARHRAAGEEK